MASFFGVHQDDISVVAGTPVQVRLPYGSKEFIARFQDVTVAWRWSTREAGVAGSSGFTVLASEGFAIDGPVNQSNIWIDHDGIGSKVLSIAYLYPSKR
jgi:hypothetical protein